ncbi:MAG: MoxR family ATPase [Granulosicoccus sp.]|nr:MoxR family ATPase [Granulosicoccus sp.]
MNPPEQPTARQLAQQLDAVGYITDDHLAATLHLMTVLEKPLLLEGEAGVGKTEIAKCLALALNTPLIRLQCYEGLDAHQALYDWDYQRQLLAIQMMASQKTEDTASALKANVYDEEYLLKRPLLRAITSPQPAVLLIDEIDRADEEFEAFLLELLSDFQITIPELGTITASSKPRVILTSNGVRDLSDALRRRCLFHYIDFPDRVRELSIIRRRLPDIDERLATQIVTFMQNLRRQQLRKTPGVAESLDWAASLMNLQIRDLTQSLDSIDITLSCIAKTQDDIKLISSQREDYTDMLDVFSNRG